jgi:hypothetical protein
MVGNALKLHRSSLVAAIAAALILGATPVYAVTCQEVRALTHEELVYWAKRLELKPEKLAVLLRKAFCEAPSGRPPDVDALASRR